MPEYCMVKGCMRHIYDQEQLCRRHLYHALAYFSGALGDCEPAEVDGLKEIQKCSLGKECDCYIAGVADGSRKECDKWIEWLQTRVERGFAWKRL